MQPLEIDFAEVNRAFSAQAARYDADERANPVLAGWRQRVNSHVDRFLRPGDHILELNAGTGIDAARFVARGHEVLATDVSNGMVAALETRAADERLSGLRVRQLSFDRLDELKGQKFDFVFSNFGGLNCIRNLGEVTRHLPSVLNPGARITWVIMPPVAPWEWLWILKGKSHQAFRRLSTNGAPASVEGILFTTYYHRAADLRRALGEKFRPLALEGLGLCSPPPSATGFVQRHRLLCRFLSRLDRVIARVYPFNRWGDHLIQTYEFRP